jgi:DNA-binding transcriptional ArsR family regulator
VSANLLSAIASPRRREILRLLRESEKAAGEIHRAMPDVSFGAVSLQLKVLLDAGLVERRTEGTRRIYAIHEDTFTPVADMLGAMWNDVLHHLKVEVELEQARRGPRSRRISAHTKRTKQGPSTKDWR